jgi:hypothetical protein
MKKFIILFFISHTALALVSPFSSSVEGITIPNTHYVSPGILRGMAPIGKMQELVDFDITDLMIFKNQTRNEVDNEYAELKGILEANIKTKQFDFLWHDYPSYKKACEDTIEALRYIREVSEDSDRKMFFHCTVGEDRTGMLAGLWDMLKNKASLKKAFYYQMCQKGYGRGNPNKPVYVYSEIRNDLTPFFMYMADQIDQGKLSLGHLTKDICSDNLPRQEILKCRPSAIR